jgi:hypothetical protein
MQPLWGRPQKDGRNFVNALPEIGYNSQQKPFLAMFSLQKTTFFN